jgi:hypothetical protein
MSRERKRICEFTGSVAYFTVILEAASVQPDSTIQLAHTTYHNPRMQQQR